MGLPGPRTDKTFAGTGGTTAYSWTATGLPTGVSIASSTGVISGSPATSGSYTAAITLTDAVGGTANDELVVRRTAEGCKCDPQRWHHGQDEAGDKITIVYSDTMKVSSFCSTWTTGDAANQTLGGANLQVNVANGTTDSITVSNTSGTGCTTFNLGTIDMASNAYVTAAHLWRHGRQHGDRLDREHEDPRDHPRCAEVGNSRNRERDHVAGLHGIAVDHRQRRPHDRQLTVHALTGHGEVLSRPPTYLDCDAAVAN